MRKIIILGAAALMLAGAMPVLAESGRGQTREWRQYDRIYRGAIRGELTPRELSNLSPAAAPH
jgi:hypothetical protein